MRSIFPPRTVRAAPYVARSDYVANARRPISATVWSASRTHPGNEFSWEKVVPTDHERHLAGQRVKGTVGRSMGENHRRGGTSNAPPPVATSWVAEIRQSARAFARPARQRPAKETLQ